MFNFVTREGTGVTDYPGGTRDLPDSSDLFDELEELTLCRRRVPQEEDVDVSSKSGAIG